MYLSVEHPLSVAAIKGYHSTLVSVFKLRLPELINSLILRDLICSFEIERPRRPVGPLSWDLAKVLTYLRGSTFVCQASAFGHHESGLLVSYCDDQEGGRALGSVLSGGVSWP